MKYMNQRTFDAFGLRCLIAKVTNESGTNFSNMVSEYNQMYSGDHLFLTQGSQCADLLIQQWSDLEPYEQANLAQNLILVRMQMDDDMNTKSTFSKIFSGAAFASSHPNPRGRINQAIINIKLMIAAV